MAQSKTALFDKELVEMAMLFKVLSHPARLRILQFLAETPTCIIGDISDELPLGRTTVNQHLKELKETGLIIGHVAGVTMNYCLNPEKIVHAKDLTSNFLTKLDVKCQPNCDKK